jgi:hypothetical protein
MKLIKILAKKNGVVFGKTEEGNVVFKQDGGKVIATGWFESLEDGWYIGDKFFGGAAESVVASFSEVK